MLALLLCWEDVSILAVSIVVQAQHGFVPVGVPSWRSPPVAGIVVDHSVIGKALGKIYENLGTP